MILVLKKGADEKKVESLKQQLKDMGLGLHLSDGTDASLIGLIGDTTEVDAEWLGALDVIESVKRIKEPYKKANKDMHPNDTIIDVSGRKIGGGNFQVIAGPCSIESREQMTEVAQDVKLAGAGLLRGGAFKPRTSPYSFQGLENEGLKMLLEAKKATGLPIVTEIMSAEGLLRGGAFKPRTSPYSFQGLENEGLKMLLEAKKATGLPIVTEIMSAEHLPLFEDVDVIQVGTRNMQNFQLLKELGKIDKPILLKRGMANTLEELLMSAEYIMAGGNEKVILCERGIRTFETSMRNTLDISAIPMLKSKTHLPVIVDPSHAAGIRFMVEPLTMAAIAAGADGVTLDISAIPMLKSKTHLPVIVDPSHAAGIRFMVEPLTMAAIAAGADGVMIEVHNNPEKALCDGKQSLTPESFTELMKKVRKTTEFFQKEI